MPRVSAVLVHPDFDRINEMIAAGWGVDRIAKKTGINKWAIWRYKRKLPPHILADTLAGKSKDGIRSADELEIIRDETSQGILFRLQQQMQRLLQAQDHEMDEGDYRGVVATSRRIAEIIKLQAQIVGELQRHTVKTTINITTTAEYVALRAGMISALASYPDARRHLAKVFQQNERVLLGDADSNSIGKRQVAFSDKTAEPALIEADHRVDNVNSNGHDRDALGA